VKDRIKVDMEHPLTKLTSWAGLENGDVVKIEGKKGDFVFLAAVQKPGQLNVDHIELLEVTRGRAQYRAFSPDRINAPGPKALARQRAARALQAAQAEG
jgi:hypothetical protein